MDLILAVFDIVQGMISQVIGTAGQAASAPPRCRRSSSIPSTPAVFGESIPLWAVTLIGSLLITVLSFVMVLTVYGRMFSLWMYAAIAPVPLSAFAGEPTSSVGKNFLRSYAASACKVWSLRWPASFFRRFPPVRRQSTQRQRHHGGVVLCGRTGFQFVVLVGAVKGCDRIVKEIMGL